MMTQDKWQIVWSILTSFSFVWTGVFDVMAEEASDAEPPIAVVEGLFNTSDEQSLGLEPVTGTHQQIYTASEESYKFCHHQNLVVWRKRLYLMWSNGIVHEDHNGQQILFCSTDDGQQWTEPSVLTKDHDGEGPFACVAAGWHAAEDQLDAYYTAIIDGKPIHERNALFCLSSSDGKVWSGRKKLAHGFYIEGPRRLSSRRLLMNGQTADRQPRLRFTDDAGGVTGWRDGMVPRLEGVFTFPEPSWFVRRDGTIVMVLRTKSGVPCLYATTSQDQGATWTVPQKTNFPDATARSFAGNLPDGRAYIINNPNTTPSKTHPSIGRRVPLVISLSHDGIVFDRALAIRAEATAMRYKGINKANGWQYPNALTWNGYLYVAYSINKEDVGVTRIDLADL